MVLRSDLRAVFETRSSFRVSIVSVPREEELELFRLIELLGKLVVGLDTKLGFLARLVMGDRLVSLVRLGVIDLSTTLTFCRAELPDLDTRRLGFLVSADLHNRLVLV